MSAPMILPMLRSDLDAVVRISDEVFPVPWSREDFAAELARTWAVVRILRPRPGLPVCAFINYWRAADEVQIMNIATSPQWRRHGFARLLLCDAIATSKLSGASLVTLEVRRSNEAARGLYASLDFEVIGVRPGYYSDIREDAVVMQRAL